MRYGIRGISHGCDIDDAIGDIAVYDSDGVFHCCIAVSARNIIDEYYTETLVSEDPIDPHKIHEDMKEFGMKSKGSRRTKKDKRFYRLCEANKWSQKQKIEYLRNQTNDDLPF